MPEDPCNQNESDVTVPTICPNEFIETEHPHEPPIGFDSGSFSISMDEQIVTPIQIPNPSDPRPNKYVLQNTSRYMGPVAVLRAMVERSDGKAVFTRYILPRTLGAQLQVWLQQSKGDAAHPLDYEDLSPEPQVVIKGDNLAIETDLPLAAHQTYKPGRQFGYQHPGYATYFRMGAWAVLDKDGGLVYQNNNPLGTPFREVGADGYHLYISFHHES